MELDGNQKGKLREGLQSAFSKGVMDLLLREELNWQSSDIPGYSDIDSVAFGSLIEYSEQEGAVAHLVLAALRKKSRNKKLNQFIQNWIQQQLNDLPDLAGGGSILSDPDLKGKLRKICSSRRDWDKFYQRDFGHLADDACTSAYTQTLALQLWVEFPEIRKNLLAVSQAIGDVMMSKTAHLLLLLQAQGANSKQMRIMSSLWLGRDSQNAIALSTEVQEQGVLCKNRKMIAEKVALLIEEAESILSQKYRFSGDIAIHFFVETKDLDNAWDQLGVDKEEVGTIYPVIVRATERYRKARYLRLLRQSWQRVQQNPDGAFACCLDCHEDVPNDATKAMLGVHWKGKFPGKREAQKAFERVLKGGVPLSIWVRCKSEDIASEEAEIAEAVETLLTGHAIHTSDSWFGKVRHTRQNSPILGKHLAVWWDDPELCPVLPGFGEAQAGKSA